MGFFTRLKREIWKVVRVILVAGILLSVIITVISYGRKIKGPEEVRMIIDSDTGNDLDDLYAITLALVHPRILLTGLCSSQYNIHPEGGDSSVYESQRINRELLRLHDTLGIPHPLGADDQCGYWGDPQPVPSPAADYIIEQANQVKFGQKINVVTLGAATNLASAIMLDSTIIPKIRWYGMAMRYDERNRIWDKNEFNVRQDLDGMDFLLNCEGLETHIMTATTSEKYAFEFRETMDLLEHRGPAWDYLTDRWKRIAPEDRNRIMWDVALIQAITDPDLVTEKEVSTPDENTDRKIYVYTWLDEKKMKRAYWKAIRMALGDVSE
jgi:inosine-uridine nucleoside N-ribohydrolase